MEAAAAAAMDFNALSRRELQALCKLNGVRANMTNVAMVEALQSLPSVDGIDKSGKMLCAPTPGKSVMKSALKAVAAGEDKQQQHGSPLPRGRRVSVKSPEAIRMDVEEGEDEMKRDLVKEIVKTPGVALRSTNRRARATPAPIPTPATGTLRRSQRAAARQATAPVEEEVSTTKKTTRGSARSKVMIALDEEEEVAAPPEEANVQEEEPKGVASDEKCDFPEEEEVTKLLEEPEHDEEVSSVASIGSTVVLDRSCDDSKVEEVVAVVEEEEATKPHEVAGIGEELELVSVEKTAPLLTMEDSPILGVMSKVESSEPAIKKVEDASIGDVEGFGEWAPVMEIADEINHASEDKEVADVELPREAVKEDETDDEPNTETSQEDGLEEENAVDANEMPQADQTDGEATEEDDLDKSSEEDDLDEEEEGATETSQEDGLEEENAVDANEMPQADQTDGEATEEDDLDKSSEEDDLDEEEEGASDVKQLADLALSEISEEDELNEEDEGAPGEMQQADLTDDASTDEIDSYETDEENDEMDEESDFAEVVSDFEEDDFSGDLPPEFDNVGNFSDAETESETSSAVLEAAKTVLESPDNSAVTEVLEVSSEEGEVSHQVDVTEVKIDTIVKSLDEFAITEEEVTEEKEPEAVGAKEKKHQVKAGENLGAMSMRKLKAMYKDSLIAAKGRTEAAA